MNLVGPVPAVLAGIVLFFVPGLVLLALLPRRDREALALDEALYLSVATSVMASSWLAIALAEAGRFSLLFAASLLASLATALLVAFRKRLANPFPRRRLRDLLPALALLSVCFAFQARPTEYLLGGRDPGTYVASMALIGRTGAIAYTDPLVLSVPPRDVELFYRNPQSPDFSWGRFMGFPLERPETGRVFPEFFHLFPAFGAYLFQAMGVKGALATPPIFGILGTLGFFFALRRLFGSPAALLASLLLAVNVVQVWFARYPVSEPVSQFLMATAFLALAHFEERGSLGFGALAGAALGLQFLVRIDSLLVLAPLAVYLLVRRAHRDLSRPQALALLLPLALLVAHAGFHAVFFARKYLVSVTTRPYWSQPVALWIGVALLAALAVYAAGHYGPRGVSLLEAHLEGFRVAAMASLLVLALYAYFLRPALSAWAGGDGNAAPAQASSPVTLALLRDLDFHRLAAHDAQAFLRLGWFVTPLGLLLGVLGLLLTIRRFQTRLLFPLLVTLTFSLFYFYKIRIYNDYYFALRRFVPVILPMLLGFAAAFLVRLAARGGVRRTLAAALAVALFACFLRDSWPLRRYTDWKGAVNFVDDVARRFSKDDAVIFEQVQSIHLLSLPLWAVHGVNILELARFNPDPEKLRDVIAAWRDRYRNVYFVHTYRTDLCGLFLERVDDYSWGSFEWERAYGRPPAKPEFRALHFTVSRVVPPEELRVPPLREIDIGGSDDFQVSGFFDKEGGGGDTYRWTGACASVYAPGARPGDRVIVRAAADQRPAQKPAAVRVSLSGVPLGSFLAGSAFADYALRLPDALPPGPAVLRFDVTTWRPINELPDTKDSRDLGVMLERIRLEAAAP